MKNCNAPENRTTRRLLPIACATALAVAFTVSLPQPAHAGRRHTATRARQRFRCPRGTRRSSWVTPVGTQNYVCLPSGTGFAWTLFTPEATLFRDRHKQIITHFFSPNPCEPNTNRGGGNGMIRATWQHSRDTSTVWAAATAHTATSSTDPDFVAPGADCLAPAYEWLEPRTDPAVATRCRRPPSSSG